MTKAIRRVFQNSRWVRPPQALLRAISMGMKMPEEPQTIRRNDTISRPRARRVRLRTDSAIVSRPNGISSCRTRSRAPPARRPQGSCSEDAATTRSTGKRQSRKLKAMALVRTAISRDTSIPAARQRREAKPGTALRRARARLVAAPSPPRVGRKAQGDDAEAERRLDGLLDQGVTDQGQRSQDEGRGNERVAPHPIGPPRARAGVPQDEDRGAGGGMEEHGREDHAGVELLVGPREGEERGPGPLGQEA